MTLSPTSKTSFEMRPAAPFHAGRLAIAIALTGTIFLGACTEQTSGLSGEDAGLFSFLRPSEQESTAPIPATSTKLVERDVEAPEVFQVTEAGLWDGRPSIGGVWIAHPDVTDPERVIIRNNANGKFVIGALFRRERAIPGPRLQVSSDAAEALSMLAGDPIELNVTALRREAVAPEPLLSTAEPIAASEIVDVAALDAPESSESTALDPIAGAAALLADTPVAETAAPLASPPAPTAPRAAPIAAALDKPYIQIGIFSVEANAKRTADQMRNAGMIPTVYEQSSNGKPFWRVVVGPSQSRSERSELLKSVKGAGFTDAYAVTH